jgi:two-component system, cell cycle sensor histidine kinase and response regulator CckA
MLPCLKKCLKRLPFLVSLPMFAAAAVLRLGYLSTLGTHIPYVTFFPAVMLAALLGGVCAGVVVTVLSSCYSAYFLIEPVGSISIHDPGDWLGLIVFLLSGLMVSWLAELTRRARKRASEAELQMSLSAERERASAALQESEARFRSYVENSPVAVFVMDREGRFVDFNASALALTGYPADTLSRMHLLELHPMDDHHGVLREFDRLFEAGHFATEARLSRRDGVQVWVSLHAAILDCDHAIAYCQDITELKGAVETMGERLALQEQLAAITAVVPGVIHSFRLGADGSCCFPYASPALEEIYGLLPEEAALDASAAFAMIHPEDRARVELCVAESARTLDNLRTEFRVCHPRRGEVWVEVHSIPSREAQGSVLWQGFLHDITARKSIEENLGSSEARFSTLVEQAADAFFVHGRDGGFVDVNLRACESLGYGREELLQLSVTDIETDHDLETLQGAWDEIEPGRHLTLRGRQRRKDGSSFPVEIRIGSYRMHGERLFLALARDITEREQSEELLRETNRRLELAIESGGVGVWDLEVATGNLVWNDRMCELYGISREAFDGSNDAWIGALHPDDRDRAQELGLAALLGEKEFKAEFRVVHPDGKVKIVRADAAVARDPEGRALRMIGLNRDITEQRSLEAQLLQAQKMEALGRLAGGVAHDFNNNLTVILGYAELSRLVEIDKEKFHEYLDEIIKAAENSRDITQQLLAFSRNEIITPRQADLNQLVRQTEKTLSRMIGEDVHLRLTTPDGIWPILIDPAQVNQIIMNLAVNARDAMPAGGMLSIETRNVGSREIGLLGYPEVAPGEYVQMTVSDTGVGMDRELQGHVFEPFFTTKALGSGTGLGLATVYGIMSQNGGFIKLASEPGRGAAFTLFFPRLAPLDDAHPVQVQAAVVGEGCVLLVEDEDSVRLMAQLMLEKAGYTVLPAATPREALEICRKFGALFDCLLTDVIMPELNGVELSVEVKKICPGIGTVFMSGYTADTIALHGVLEPGVFFVQKPFDVPTLADKIQQAILLSQTARQGQFAS